MRGRTLEPWDPYISLPAKDTVNEAIDHLKMAERVMLANGYAVPMTLLSMLGYDTLLLGFDKTDLAEVRNALTYLEKATAQGIHGGNKVTLAAAYWNLAIARLAAGESREIDPEVFRKLNESGDAELIISCFTDLKLLDKNYPFLHGGANCLEAIEQAKQRLVAAFPPQDWETIPTTSVVPDCAERLPMEPDIMVSPHTVEWRGLLPQLPGDQDNLCLIWYIRGS